MSMIVDDTASQIAGRIRLERENRQWSLADLAARSGVSKAMISKIERREASPTATVLVRLAGAFELTLAGLLARAEDRADWMIRAEAQPTWRDPATGYLRRQVFEHADHPIEMVRVELPPGRRVDLPASSYSRIRQVVWLMQGALTIEEAGERRALSVGDSLAFGPPADSAFINEGAEPCVYLVVVARA